MSSRPPIVSTSQMPNAAGVGHEAPQEPPWRRGCPLGNDIGSSERAQKNSVSFTGCGLQYVIGNFQPSDSGNGLSGVRRVTGASPSSPLRASRRKSEPCVNEWCADAVATHTGVPAIGLISVPTHTRSE